MSQQIASLRQLGAERLEPVQFHYVQALCQRASTRQGSVRRILEGKLAQALAGLQQRLHPAPRAANQAAAAPLEREIRDGLAALTRDLSQHQARDARWPERAGSSPELKSAEFFRDTWSRISAAKQVTQALEKAPKNAGPINSHRVVLGSLALMRDISPDYLNRFMCYVDTLLLLEHRGREALASAKTTAAGTKAASRRADVSPRPAPVPRGR